MFQRGGHDDDEVKKENVADPYKSYNIDAKYLGLLPPFRALVQGPSSSGKSTLILNILKNKEKMFPGYIFDKVAYCYPENAMTDSRQNYVAELEKIFPQIETHEGMPSSKDVLKATGKKLLIIDDLYMDAANSYDFQQILLHGSHHNDCSLFIGRYFENIKAARASTTLITKLLFQ